MPSVIADIGAFAGLCNNSCIVMPLCKDDFPQQTANVQECSSLETEHELLADALFHDTHLLPGFTTAFDCL